MVCPILVYTTETTMLSCYTSRNHQDIKNKAEKNGGEVVIRLLILLIYYAISVHLYKNCNFTVLCNLMYYKFAWNFIKIGCSIILVGC